MTNTLTEDKTKIDNELAISILKDRMSSYKEHLEKNGSFLSDYVVKEIRSKIKQLEISIGVLNE